MIGYLQQQIIDIGKVKGYVTSEDVRAYFTKNIDVEMNKLVILGYFEKSEDCGTFIKWKRKK